MKNQIMKVGYKVQINIQDIYRAEADVNYTILHLTNGKKLSVAKTLKKIESELSEYEQFFRINKSAIINLSAITCVYESKLRLTNGNVMTLARRRRKDFLATYGR